VKSGASPSAAGRAFTLLEVLVALAIFALTAVVLGAAYLNILNSYQAMHQSPEDAQDIAFARRALLTQPDMQTAENGDEFDTADGHHVQWSSTIDFTTSQIPDVCTVTFICEITNSPTDQPRKFAETFTLLRPTWSEPADRSTKRQAEAARIAKAQGLQP